MPQREFELAEGVRYASQKISRLLRQKERTLVIAVVGASGSGKTSRVSAVLKKEFGKSAKILSCDCYYRGLQFMKSIGSSNWDDPLALELEIIPGHLRAIKAGKPIWVPRYSFKKGIRIGHHKFLPPRILILEGLFALHGPIAREVDFGLFVDVTIHGSLIRRILRDIGRTGQTEEDIFRQYVETVYPMFREHIEPARRRADIILTNHYTPEESRLCEKQEIQIKAAINRAPRAKLKSLGFVKVGDAWETDEYFSYPGWVVPCYDELMRVREVSPRSRKGPSSFFVAYKGPESGKDMRIKPKIEFPVEATLSNGLRSLGYNSALIVKKRRETFLSLVDPDVEIVLDNVEGLGRFLEIRLAQKPCGGEEAAIKERLALLGIDERAATKEPYYQLMTH